jgi:hypothetical protein
MLYKTLILNGAPTMEKSEVEVVERYPGPPTSDSTESGRIVRTKLGLQRGGGGSIERGKQDGGYDRG